MKYFLGFVGAVILIGVVGWILGWFGSAGVVASEEFGPQAMLQKYEWFVDQSNAIKKADADIAVYEQRRTDVENQYVSSYGADKSAWPPSAMVQYNHDSSIARDDLVAIVSNRNSLVRDYNAQSEKFNWAPFMTRTDLPPQSFAEYTVK